MGGGGRTALEHPQACGCCCHIRHPPRGPYIGQGQACWRSWPMDWNFLEPFCGGLARSKSLGPGTGQARPLPAWGLGCVGPPAGVDRGSCFGPRTGPAQGGGVCSCHPTPPSPPQGPTSRAPPQLAAPGPYITCFVPEKGGGGGADLLLPPSRDPQIPLPGAGRCLSRLSQTSWSFRQTCPPARIGELSGVQRGAYR